MTSQTRSADLEKAARPVFVISPAKMALIEEVLDSIRPTLARDGGGCELLKVEENRVYLKLKGACVLCKLASMTVNGIQERLIEALGMPVRVIPSN